MFRNTTRIASIAAVAAMMMVGSANAAPITTGTTIGVDFGPTAPTNSFNDITSIVATGGTSAGTASIAPGSVIDTSGVVVDGVGFSLQIGFNPSAGGGFLNADADETQIGQPSVFNVSNLTDWLGTASVGAEQSIPDSMILTFTGLPVGGKYDLIIGAAFAGSIADTLWQVDGQSATSVPMWSARPMSPSPT